MTTTNPSQPIDTTIRHLLLTWLQPRLTDRDEAFRERVIRIALALLLSITVLSLINSVFVYSDTWHFISFPAMNVYGILLYLGSAYAVITKRLVLSGWLLTLGSFILLIMVSLIELQEYQAISTVSKSAFLIIPLLSTLVLPRRYILFFAAVAALGYSSLYLLLPGTVDDFSVASQIFAIFLLIGLEGLMLYQFRREFDARLESLAISLEQEEIAKNEAEAARIRSEQADQAKSQFLANMSHELRTPLNAIIGYDEAMLGGMVGDFAPKQFQLLGHIQYNSRRLLGLINDVLDLSKIESGSLQVFVAPLSPQQVMTRIVESVKNLADEKGIALEVTFADDVPELVLSDEKKIEQILINLISNAVKFTSKGGVYVDVTAYDNKHWQFKVRDTGIGVAPEMLADIFEPFRQVDNSSTRKYKGTGLGLSISKRLTEILNGEIKVESELNQGTTFMVILPRTFNEDQTLEEQMKQAKSKAEHPIA